METELEDIIWQRCKPKPEQTAWAKSETLLMSKADKAAQRGDASVCRTSIHSHAGWNPLSHKAQFHCGWLVTLINSVSEVRCDESLTVNMWSHSAEAAVDSNHGLSESFFHRDLQKPNGLTFFFKARFNNNMGTGTVQEEFWLRSLH